MNKFIISQITTINNATGIKLLTNLLCVTGHDDKNGEGGCLLLVGVDSQCRVPNS